MNAPPTHRADLDWSTMRRLGFYAFAVLVGVNALLAIAAFVGDYSRENEILGTSAVLSVAVLGLLANAPAIERGPYWPVAVLGIGAIALWAGMLIYAVWDDFSTDDGFEKVMWGALFVGLGASYMSIMGTIRLTDGQRQLRAVANLFAAASALLAVRALSDSVDASPTPIAICVIVAIAFAVVLPVLGRLNRAELTTVAIAAFCPLCGAPVAADRAHGNQHCAECDATFSIELPG